MMEARLILAVVAQRYKLMLERDQKVVPMQVITVKPRGPDEGGATGGGTRSSA